MTPEIYIIIILWNDGENIEGGIQRRKDWENLLLVCNSSTVLVMSHGKKKLSRHFPERANFAMMTPFSQTVNDALDLGLKNAF